MVSDLGARPAMTDDDSRKIADATLNKVKQFTVGLGRAGEKPAAKGSGVLVKQGELTGILTCAHVATHLRELKRPVTLAPDPQNSQVVYSRATQDPRASTGLLGQTEAALQARRRSILDRS